MLYVRSIKKLIVLVVALACMQQVQAAMFADAKAPAYVAGQSESNAGIGPNVCGYITVSFIKLLAQGKPVSGVRALATALYAKYKRVYGAGTALEDNNLQDIFRAECDAGIVKNFIVLNKSMFEADGLSKLDRNACEALQRFDAGEPLFVALNPGGHWGYLHCVKAGGSFSITHGNGMSKANAQAVYQYCLTSEKLGLAGARLSSMHDVAESSAEIAILRSQFMEMCPEYAGVAHEFSPTKMQDLMLKVAKPVMCGGGGGSDDLAAVLEASKLKWDCAACTTRNVGCDACIVCCTPCPKKIAAASIAEWNCTACSYDNEGGAAACTMCGTPQPEAPAPAVADDAMTRVLKESEAMRQDAILKARMGLSKILSAEEVARLDDEAVAKRWYEFTGEAI